MSDVVAELASRIRLSDPKPARCAGCWCSAGPEVRFVDFDGVAVDRGAIVDEGSMAVVDSIDELHLCEACVRSASEVLGLKPGLHSRQLHEIRRLELENDSLRGYVRRLEAAFEVRPELAAKGRGR